MGVYTALKEAGCEMANHESDLYVKMTPVSTELTKDEKNRTIFRSNLDNQMWYEIPFAFTPWWEKRDRS